MTTDLDAEILGAGLAYPLTQDLNGFRSDSGEDSVRSTIMLIIGTPQGERVMGEDFGTPLQRLIFQNPESAKLIAPEAIKEAIIRYEPRVSGVRVSATETPTPGTLDIQVRYLLKGTRTEGTIQTQVRTQ